MAIFNSYVKLPEGINYVDFSWIFHIELLVYWRLTGGAIFNIASISYSFCTVKAMSAMARTALNLPSYLEFTEV
jgi:hypothetical protein